MYFYVVIKTIETITVATETLIFIDLQKTSKYTFRPGRASSILATRSINLLINNL